MLLLGPATNLAGAISLNKDIIQNIENTLFIGGNSLDGRRFFPQENSKLISFRDFNFVKDKYSFGFLFNTSLPLHLAGYELASQMIFKKSDFKKEFPLMGKYLSEKSMEWLKYWKDNFNIDGFYPFDYAAVSSIFYPDEYNCISSKAKIEKSTFLFWEIMKSIKLGNGKRSVTYCI